MICPDCGSEVAEGLMYCAVCGREFHMVPEYEPEIESQIDRTLSRLARKIDGEGMEEKAQRPSGQRKRPDAAGRKKQQALRRKKKERQRKIAIAAGAGALLIVVLVLVITRVHRSVGDYIALAKRAQEAGDASGALSYLQTAREKDPRNTEVIFLLADYLRESGDLTGSIRELDTIVNSAAFEEADLKRAFRDTAQMYVTLGETAQLAALMERCPFEDIRSVYMVAVPDAPVISPAGGAFESFVDVTLTAQEGVSLYYTLDGTEPDEGDMLYEGVIHLSVSGDFRVQAVAITDGGVRSAVVSAQYKINPAVVEPPQVVEDSGYYTSETQIVVAAAPGLTIHYTTQEREKPTTESPVYAGPIDMPVGDSFFNFVCADEQGNLSEVVSRQYNLTISRNISEAQATARVKEALMRAGIITDLTGATGDGSILEFEVENTIHIGEDEYYYIREYRVAPGGGREATGLLYAVQTDSGFTSRLGISNGQYVLNAGI